MRIVLVSHAPRNPDGGASRIYHLLDEGLTGRGHVVETYHLEDLHPPRHDLALLGVQRLAMPQWIDRQARRMDVGKVDVVMSSSGMGGPMFRRLRRAPGPRPLLVNHVHGLVRGDHVAYVSEAAWGHRRVSLAYRWLSAPLAMRWDEIGIREGDVTLVQNLRDLGEAKRMKPGLQAHLVPAAVHPELLALSEAIAPSSERRADSVVWCGTWEARKGASYVPQAFRRLRHHRPGATLALVGTGQAGPGIVSEFDERDRPAVTVLPRITRQEQAQLYNRSSLMLFPSISEGFGLALPEAMAFGLAAVTTSTAFGGDHVTDHVTGRVVPPSGEHLGDALVQLAEDDAARAGIASRGRSLARSFTPERMVDAYESLFAGCSQT